MNEEEMDDFVFLWQEYAKESDSKLTVNAIKLKQEIIDFVNNLPVFKESNGGKKSQ